MRPPPLAAAEAVRAALVEAAREAYEQAGIAGLCAEGRWELALDAMRTLDLALVAPGVPGPPDVQPPDDTTDD